jgi:hypothetical protein
MKKFLTLIFIFFLLLVRFYKLESRNEYTHAFPEVMDKNEKDYLSFQDITETSGISFKFENQTYSQQMKNYKNFIPSTTCLSVADVNNDGFEDFITCNGNSKKQLYLFINNKDETFTDKSMQYGINDSSALDSRLAANFFDFDNDGYQDLIVASRGFLTLYKNIKGKIFKNISSQVLDRYLGSLITNIRVLDYNKDGYSDLYISSLFKMSFVNKKAEGYFVPTTSKNEFKVAGPNYLFINNSGKTLSRVENAAGASNDQIAWDSVVADFNHDGWPDIIVANDYSIVRFYENNQRGRFVETTKYRVPSQYSSSNMGISISDINFDGKFDYFITNVSNARFTTTNHNHLFLHNKNDKYENFFETSNIKRCGWAWGSQFVDLDLDGKDELFVSNGYFKDGLKDYYYNWVLYASLPPFLITNPKVLPPTEGYSLAGEEKNCLFKQANSKEIYYRDIAEDAGIKDVENGRGVVTIDLMNNGKQSILISNYNHHPILYKNIAPKMNNWLGIMLEGGNSGKDLIGTVLQLNYKNKKIKKYYNPGQGFSSQTTKRVIFGVGDETLANASLDIIWPSGKEVNIKNLKLNSYNLIKE